MVTWQPCLTPCSASSMDHGAPMSSRRGQPHCSAGLAMLCGLRRPPTCLPCYGHCLASSALNQADNKSGCPDSSCKNSQHAAWWSAITKLPPTTAWLPAGMTASWCLCWRRGSRGYLSRPRWQQLHSDLACMHQLMPAGMHLCSKGLLPICDIARHLPKSNAVYALQGLPCAKSPACKPSLRRWKVDTARDLQTHASGLLWHIDGGTEPRQLPVSGHMLLHIWVQS